MNTQTHIIMGAALLGKRLPKRAWAAAAGGLVPDLPMLVIVFSLIGAGFSPHVVFGEMYWQNWWQVTNAIGHNYWLWGGLSVLAVVLRERLTHSLRAVEGWTIVACFSLSALLHTFIDFLCHREDGHMSFWPVTRWKFISPVSYWDNAHYALYFRAFEFCVGVALAVILFRQFRNIWLRAALILALAIYVAEPLFFMLHLG